MSRRFHSDRGAAAVEMVFATLFILLPLFLGVVDLGRAFSASIALSDIAEETALYAAFEGWGATENEIKTHATQVASFPLSADDVDPKCVIRDRRDLDGASIRVVVNYTFDGIFFRNLQLARSAYVEGIADCGSLPSS